MTTTLLRDLTPDQERHRDALVALLVAGFILDVGALAAAIHAARIAAWQATAARIADDLDLTGDLPAPDAAALQAEVVQTAHGIAATWRRDVRIAAAALVTAWLLAHGTLHGARAPLGRALRRWARAHAEWKAAQIANAETGASGHAATLAVLALILGGALAYAGQTAALTVTVHPDTAAESFCAAYAGKTYPASMASSIGPFPAHPNCVHYVAVNA